MKKPTISKGAGSTIVCMASSACCTACAAAGFVTFAAFVAAYTIGH